MKGLADKMGEQKISALGQDCDTRGQCILGIEDMFDLFQHSRANVDVYDKKRGHLSKSWRKIMAKTPLKPLVCTTKVVDGDLRPSEFGCYIARIFSKVDLEKAGKIFNFTLDTRLADIGTTRHELCLTQHVEKFEHAERSGFPPRYDYCEKPVSYVFESKILDKEIISSGRPDNRFTIDNLNDVGVIDLKRGRKIFYGKDAVKRQLRTYALGIAQQVGINTVYTITSPGPTFPKRFRDVLPQLQIAKFHVESPVVARLHEELEESFIEQARLLDSLQYLLERKGEKRTAQRGCRNYDTGFDCFDKPACGPIINYCAAEKRCLRDVLEEFKLVRKGYRLPQL
jgi:hypothetical protein